MSTAIISIGTTTPAFKIAQSDIADVISKQLDPNSEYAANIQTLFNRSGITNRNGVIPLSDMDKNNPAEKLVFYKDGNTQPPSITERIGYHIEKDVLLSAAAIDDCLQKVKMDVHEITHLITVTTTGVRCPGLDYDLSHHYGLKSSVERFHLHFGGCHAGMQAMRQANYICRSNKDAVVMIVCVEFNTLYYNEITTKEQLIISLLFGDGVCATLMVNEAKREALNVPGFIINSAHSVTLPNTADGVQVRLHKNGFEASISPKLPDYINQYLPDFVATNLWLQDMEKSAVDYWALHPGGKKILNTVSTCLGIDRNELRFSFEVLNKLGNTESVSIMYVLLEIWNDFIAGGKNAANICAVGFGPGVTVELMMMEAVCPDNTLPEDVATDQYTSTLSLA